MPISTIDSAGINQAGNATFCTTSGNVGIGTASPTFKIQAQGSTPAYFGVSATDGTQVGYAAALPSNSVSCFVGWIPDSVGTGGVNGDLALQPRTSAGANIRFFTGTTSASERARIDTSGNLLVGTTSSGGVGFTVATDASGRYVISNTSFGGGFTHYSFRYNGTQVGSISTTTTNTTYSTSSDYRLKEDISPMTGALAKVSALKPCTYKWKADGSDGEGFIAHELQEVVPQCVTGEKDATRIERVEVSPAVPATYDEDGNELAPAVEAVYEEREVPAYQGIDTSFLVATLTAAIQELKADLDATKAELAAMKGTA